MKFFMPGLSEERTKEVWQAIWEFSKQTMGREPTQRKIFAIDYVHNGKAGRAEVGKNERADTGPERVEAILEVDGCYLVCTENRGVYRGCPILIGEGEASNVEEF